MNKRTRQYVGLLSAIFSYYLIHEGAHFVYALVTGTFKKINVMGIGVQIDIFADRMTQAQLGIFCILGSVFTLLSAYLLVALANKIANVPSQLFKACMYYITIVMLMLDPIYLSALCGLFGGGDMNGISLLIPEAAARVGYGLILIINIIVFIKIVLPKYKMAFADAD